MERCNHFVRHHRDSIRFGYHSFDRILCYGRIPAFWGLGHVVCFLRERHQVTHIKSRLLKQISGQCHEHVIAAAQRLHIPLVLAPSSAGLPKGEKVRRQDWVQPYYEEFGAAKFGTAVILKLIFDSATPFFASRSRFSLVF